MKRFFRLLTKLLCLLALVLAVLAVVIAMRPADFRYTRSATIAAPPEVVFEQVNDLRKFQEWNPWAKVDPNAAITYDGPPTGEGSSYSWSGDAKVGKGTMTIIETKPGELVRARMEFKEPFAATHTADFTFRREEDGTVVSWSMYGSNDFLGKAVSLFIDCDKMIGDEFSKGLATLKGKYEK
jgi:uncharacterized protein YndB with AHSA1/START domain